jgi:hypothetical protein
MVDRNRRKHRRVKMRSISTRLSAGGAMQIGLAIEDMSLGGCFVRCSTPFKVGTEVSLEIHPAGTTSSIQVLGRVVSKATPGVGRDSGMGIAFFPLPRDVSQRIEALIGDVDPTAVRGTIEATEPRAQAAPRASLTNAAELHRHIAALTEQLKKRDARIAELESQVERLRQRLILYGGKL